MAEGYITADAALHVTWPKKSKEGITNLTAKDAADHGVTPSEGERSARRSFVLLMALVSKKGNHRVTS